MTDPQSIGSVRVGLTVEELICRALPEEADRQHRICLLRLHHAAERADTELATLGWALGAYLRDPVPIYSGPLLGSAAEASARRLVSLAAELRKSASELPGMVRERYRRKSDSWEGEAV